MRCESASCSARTLIEKDPAYSFVTARLLLDAIRFEALGEEATQADMATKYADYFPRFVKHGIKIGLLNEGLAHYDLKTLGAALVPSRDIQFGYLGLQTLYDRYFLIDQYAKGGASRRSSCRRHSSCGNGPGAERVTRERIEFWACCRRSIS
jgi:ribonucleoside-diphosphate reductase alpha chain